MNKILISVAVLAVFLAYCEAMPLFQGEPKERAKRGVWDTITGTFHNIDPSQIPAKAALYKDHLLEFMRQHHLKQSFANLGRAGMELTRTSVAKLHRLLNGNAAPVVIAGPVGPNTP
uniref:Uncharacterized LOC101242656 n=1 Tax=Ciona intestinalis TaxID=7719 RepID=F6PUN1_CIOIN|nr:uncharacterized protein LOC101242656 [Ciona intestinalis]|eukprot:XP_004226471.1 uncharacterized protein LOC101242656 [Ciona intestinalis]